MESYYTNFELSFKRINKLFLLENINSCRKMSLNSSIGTFIFQINLNVWKFKFPPNIKREIQIYKTTRYIKS